MALVPVGHVPRWLEQVSLQGDWERALSLVCFRDYSATQLLPRLDLSGILVSDTLLSHLLESVPSRGRSKKSPQRSKALPNALIELSVDASSRLTDAACRPLTRVAPSLQHLSLVRQAVTDTGIAPVLAAAVRLRTLDLSRCRRVGDAVMVAAQTGLRRLHTLRMAGTAVSDVGLAALSKRSRTAAEVVTLDISRCPNLTDAGITVLLAGGRCPESLSIAACYVTNVLPSALAHRSRPLLVQALDVSNLSKWSDDAFRWLAAAELPALATFTARHLLEPSDEAFAELFRASPTLVRVDVTGCANVGDASLTALLGTCRGIEHLTLAGCTKVTDAPWRVAAKRGEPLVLEHIDASGLSRLTDAAMRALGGGLAPQLATLCLCGRQSTDAKSDHDGAPARSRFGAPRVSARGLTAILEGCPSLTDLNLTDVRTIDEVGTAEAIAVAPSLLHLRLAGCAQLGDGFAAALADATRKAVLAWQDRVRMASEAEAAEAAEVEKANEAIRERNRQRADPFQEIRRMARHRKLAEAAQTRAKLEAARNGMAVDDRGVPLPLRALLADREAWRARQQVRRRRERKAAMARRRQEGASAKQSEPVPSEALAREHPRPHPAFRPRVPVPNSHPPSHQSLPDTTAKMTEEPSKERERSVPARERKLAVLRADLVRARSARPSSLSELRTLDLSRTSASGKGVHELLSAMTSFISGTKRSASPRPSPKSGLVLLSPIAARVLHVPERTHPLTHLILGHCPGASDEGTALLQTGAFPLLQSLVCTGAHDLSPAAAARIAEGCPRLRRFSLHDCDQMDAVSLAHVATRLPLVTAGRDTVACPTTDPSGHEWIQDPFGLRFAPSISPTRRARHTFSHGDAITGKSWSVWPKGPKLSSAEFDVVHRAQERALVPRASKLPAATLMPLPPMVEAAVLRLCKDEAAVDVLRRSIRGFAFRKVLRVHAMGRARALLAERRAAALVLQRTYRGHLGRSDVAFRILYHVASGIIAAVVLQRHARGLLHRRDAAKHKRARHHWLRGMLRQLRLGCAASTAQRRHHGAVLLQHAWWRHMERRRSRARALAEACKAHVRRTKATAIQALVRGRAGRQRAAHSKVALWHRIALALRPLENALTSAVCVQRFWRGYAGRCRARRMYISRTIAAIHIQALARGHAGRKVAAARRHVLMACATQISAAYRGVLQRRNLAIYWLRDARPAPLLPIVYTMPRSCYSEDLSRAASIIRRRQTLAAVKIQTWIRCATTHIAYLRRLAREKEARRKAALAQTLLACAWRCHLARSLVRRTRARLVIRHRSALQIQCTYRGYAARQLAVARRRDRLNRRVREDNEPSTERGRRCYETLRHGAAWRIQSVWRRIARLRAQERERAAAAIAIQRVFRGHSARRQYKNTLFLRHAAARLIQSVWRGIIHRRKWKRLVLGNVVLRAADERRDRKDKVVRAVIRRQMRETDERREAAGKVLLRAFRRAHRSAARRRAKERKAREDAAREEEEDRLRKHNRFISLQRMNLISQVAEAGRSSDGIPRTPELRVVMDTFEMTLRRRRLLTDILDVEEETAKIQSALAYEAKCDSRVRSDLARLPGDLAYLRACLADAIREDTWREEEVSRLKDIIDRRRGELARFVDAVKAHIDRVGVVTAPELLEALKSSFTPGNSIWWSDLHVYRAELEHAVKRQAGSM